MDERMMQFRVGVVVLFVALIAAFLTLLFGHFPAAFGRRTYTIYIDFAQTPGIDRETPIRKAGVLIGRVAKVDLHNEPPSVTLTADIDDGRTIMHDEGVRVATGLLGDSELQVVSRHDPSLPKTPVGPGETIVGVPSINPMDSLTAMQNDFDTLAHSLTGTSNEVSKLAHDIDQLLGNNDKQFNRLLDKTEKSLDNLNKTMTDFDSIIGDPAARDQLRESIAHLPEALKQTENALALIQKTSTRAERNLANLEGFTKPLGERGETIINNADQSVRRLDELLDQMQRFSRQLNSREGSLGQLMYNPDLYRNLNDAATNINELSKELKPIVSDARVISDKIARHPEVLGVGGALRPSAGTK
jgi:phospholipid/cholesterol/gamma-HCH transport system substrate-binding protein